METQNEQNHERPIGYWLKAADRLLAAEFARAFEAEGITRREWRLLNVIDGSAPERPLDKRKLGRLIELGWIAPSDEGWTLTEDGRAAKERLSTVVDGIRATISDAVAPEDYATTIATLEQISRALGWDEHTPLPRKPRAHGHHGRHRFGGRGFGPHRAHGFSGHGFEPDPRNGSEHGCRGHRAFGPHRDGHRGHGDGEFSPRHGRRGHEFVHRERVENDEFAPRGGHGHPHRRFARFAQHAYERGFDAGFHRGRGAY
ncbi:hypothetical protein [Microbacterium sp. CIAB417]|uniref:hypothetical protein n=1 Tax=Microbacterium sp. CIAB417 TaxID=2860287 RepID=UPI001FAD6CAD|nr:hypothetical protein [Microbacterium sp. CIAB417]